MPRMPAPIANRLTPAIGHATTLATALLAPLTVLVALTVHTRQRLFEIDEDPEAGLSEITVVALLAGIAAIVVVAYMAIVRGKVLDEANNLPTSG